MTILERQKQLSYAILEHLKMVEPNLYCRTKTLEKGTYYTLLRMLRTNRGIKEILSIIRGNIRKSKKMLINDYNNERLSAMQDSISESEKLLINTYNEEELKKYINSSEKLFDDVKKYEKEINNLNKGR